MKNKCQKPLIKLHGDRQDPWRQTRSIVYIDIWFMFMAAFRLCGEEMCSWNRTIVYKVQNIYLVFDSLK